MIGSSFDGYAVYASDSSDFDGDGDMDVLGGANAEGISWFESPGFAPTISSVSLNAANTELTVTFSENVYNTNGGSGDLEVADFALSKSGGVATVNATPGSISSSDPRVWVLGVTITGTADGGETLTVVPAAGTAIYDASGNAASTTQSNNTASLTEKVLPTISSVSLNAANTELTVTFSENVYNTNGGSGDLEVADFALSKSGGVATVNATPGSISSSDPRVWVLGVTITGTADGGETLTVVPAAGTAIYDASGNAASTTQSNNTASLTEKVLPTITNLAIYDTDFNGLIDKIIVTFSENVDTDDGNAPVAGDFGTIILPDGQTADLTGASFTDPAGSSNTVTITGIAGQSTQNTAVGATAIDGITNQWKDGAANATSNPDDAETITDVAAPQVSDLAIYDTDFNGLIDKIIVTFSENVDTDDGKCSCSGRFWYNCITRWTKRNFGRSIHRSCGFIKHGNDHGDYRSALPTIQL